MRNATVYKDTLYDRVIILVTILITMKTYLSKMIKQTCGLEL